MNLRVIRKKLGDNDLIDAIVGMTNTEGGTYF